MPGAVIEKIVITHEKENKRKGKSEEFALFYFLSSSILLAFYYSFFIIPVAVFLISDLDNNLNSENSCEEVVKIV